MLRTLLILFSSVLFFFITTSASAQTPPVESYSKGEISKIVEEGTRKVGSQTNRFQIVQVNLLDSPPTSVTIEYGGIVNLADNDRLSVGDLVVVQQTTLDGKNTYAIVDKYRLDLILWIIGGFFVLVTGIAGLRGLGAILGMLVSLGVIILFIVPQILSGHDPLGVSIIGSIVIMLVTLYLAHGFSRQTTIAVVSTAVVLLLTGFLAFTFVHGAQLTGTGNEESSMLQFGTSINLQGLLLGGIIIGALGVLDDITTSQVAAVYEIMRVNPTVSFLELTRRGLRIGREHIASLVNTLVLAYAGASLALFILFVMNPANQPYWVIFNSQEITEEIIRTIAGSIGLTFAVPISTALAAWQATRK